MRRRDWRLSSGSRWNRNFAAYLFRILCFLDSGTISARDYCYSTTIHSAPLPARFYHVTVGLILDRRKICSGYSSVKRLSEIGSELRHYLVAALGVVGGYLGFTIVRS